MGIPADNLLDGRGTYQMESSFLVWLQLQNGSSQERKPKKEEFTGLMFTWCLGTPFPRSALFLK
jgi:hypothetical protein